MKKLVFSVFLSFILSFSMCLSVFCDSFPADGSEVDDFDIFVDDYEDSEPAPSEPAQELPPIVFNFPDWPVSTPSDDVSEPSPDSVPVSEPAAVDLPATIAVYEGSGIYHILKQFIGATFDVNQSYNEYQYLYPASVIVSLVLIVLVAKVLFSLVDRLL